MSVEMDFSEVRALALLMQHGVSETERLLEVAVARTGKAVEARAKVASPVRTGFHRGSISTDVQGLEAEVGPTSEYGGYLEFGTSKMAPRPHLVPALEAELPAFVRAVQMAGGQILA